ncbi:MAG TPA: thioesterase domain-containing protein [Burkholderiales bacterium]|nr:thioesterase domain-containing protein [Burkholderiales bacterium]
MNLQTFLADLYDREIELWADGDRLRCKAPAGVLTTTLRNELMERKSEILAFLRTAEAAAKQPRAIVPLQPHGTRPPVFAVAGHNGDVFTYRTFAAELGNDQPFFGLEPPGLLDGDSEPMDRVEDLAAYFAEQIRTLRPDGPFVIAGYCAGGAIAFELARQLKQQGASILFLAMLAAPYPSYCRFSTQISEALALRAQSVRNHLRTLTKLSLHDGRQYLVNKLNQRKLRRQAQRVHFNDPVLRRRDRVANVTVAAVARYTPGTYDGRVSLFLPNKEWIYSRAEPLRWRVVAPRAEQHFVPEDCNPDILLLEPDVAATAELFRRCRDTSAMEMAS